MYGCKINQTLIRDAATSMVRLGLAKHGYTYLNMDDCWQSWRNSSGIIQPDNTTFPDGVQPLVEYAHSLGLKFGLYSDAGSNTCQGRPGSLGHEQSDADTYAGWGVDYLKYDNCHNEGLSPKLRYPPMRDALNASGRAIFFSMCEWGREDPAQWAPAVGNSWRTSEDIKNDWFSIMHNIDTNDLSWKTAAPGGWNDPDMLECPNPAVPGAITESEFRVHFALWAIAKAPLIIGCDLNTLSNETLAVLMNKGLIGVNQDPLAVQGHAVARNHADKTDVWAGPLSGSRSVVALVNRDPSAAHPINVTFAQVGFPSSAPSLTFYDVFEGSSFVVTRSPFMVSVAPRSVESYIISSSQN